MAKFRKKPVSVDAFLWTGGPDQGEDPEWIIDAIKRGDAGSDKDGNSFWVSTLEGTMTAFPGDYIIRGIKGEIYPCKADIFAMTHEPECLSAEVVKPEKVTMGDIGRLVLELMRWSENRPQDQIAGWLRSLGVEVGEK